VAPLSTLRVRNGADFAGGLGIGFGLVLSQALLGGMWYQFLVLVPLLILGSSAVLCLFSDSDRQVSTKCLVSFFALLVYMFWRQISTTDDWAGGAHTLILLGAAVCYMGGAVASAKNSNARIGAITWVLFSGIILQFTVVLAQSSAGAIFHPLGDWILGIGLPDGDTPNRGRFITGTFFSRSGLAGVCGSLGLFLFTLAIWGRLTASTKIVFLWGAGVAWSCVFLSASRAGVIGLLGGLVFLGCYSLLIYARGRFVGRRGLLLVAAVLGAVPVFIFWLFLKNNHYFSLSIQRLTADEYREHLWFHLAPIIFPLSPWIGGGANSFSTLALRYRTPEHWGNPVYAHNDWLQLLLDYGLVGLSLALVMFFVHIWSAGSGSLLLCKKMTDRGIFPQSDALGYRLGGAVGIVGAGAQAFFDYNLNVPAALWLVCFFCGLCARIPDESDLVEERVNMPESRILRWASRLLLASLALLIFTLTWSMWRAEKNLLLLENCIASGSLERCWSRWKNAIENDPEHPRLNEWGGRILLQKGINENSIVKRTKLFKKAADSFEKALRGKHGDPAILRDYALCLSLAGFSEKALKVHIFAISRDPFHANGYQGLSAHFQILGKTEESRRLLDIAKKLPGYITPSAEQQ
jgi:O-antigen ligase